MQETHRTYSEFAEHVCNSINNPESAPAADLACILLVPHTGDGKENRGRHWSVQLGRLEACMLECTAKKFAVVIQKERRWMLCNGFVALLLRGLWLMLYLTPYAFSSICRGFQLQGQVPQHLPQDLCKCLHRLLLLGMDPADCKTKAALSFRLNCLICHPLAWRTRASNDLGLHFCKQFSLQKCAGFQFLGEHLILASAVLASECQQYRHSRLCKSLLCT